MTYIAQNEYAAMYIPTRFLPQVNPRQADLLMWLARHLRSAGFDAPTARHMSDLHTPNLM
jgi:hypothetical protein